METSQPVPGLEVKLGPELTAEVYKALNFDPAVFAKRHGDEFVRMYLRADGMLAYVGEEIVPYLAKRINECLSRAEYALLSYIEYAGRGLKEEGSDCFSQAVSGYLKVRQKVGSGWTYAFEREEFNCAKTYPQMRTMAKAMYVFAKKTGAFKEVVRTDGPDAWPDPKKMKR